jgi:integrase
MSEQVTEIEPQVEDHEHEAQKPKRRPKKRSRIYWRTRGGKERAYADFRDYRDVGGGREALVPNGLKLATTDPIVAEVLAAERVAELEGMRRNRTLVGATGARLGPYAQYHLEAKAKAGRTTDRHLVNAECYLRRAVDYFGADRALDSIRVVDVVAWMDHLGAQPGRRGQTLSGATRRHHLNALSNVYRRAIGEEVVPAGYNPAAGVMEKPQGRRFEATWLEVPDASLLLEAARVDRRDATQSIYPILATLLLTGGRKSEVLGLAVEDVRFGRGRVVFRPNEFRRLKTKTSDRVVPLWPQLREILRDYLFGRDEAQRGLLFPSPRTGGMVTDFRKSLNAIATRAGFAPGEVTSKALRHTYISARLQTVDHGAPVSAFTVAREAGHGGVRLVERIYGHLGEVRHRSEAVEYKAQDYRDVLGDRLEALWIKNRWTMRH